MKRVVRGSIGCVERIAGQRRQYVLDGLQRAKHKEARPADAPAEVAVRTNNAARPYVTVPSLSV